MLKGLQGEPQETLEGLELAISTTEKFFESYSTYCFDLMPKLFRVGVGMVQEHLTPAHQHQTDSPPPLPESATSLGVSPHTDVWEDGRLLAQAQDHQGDSTAFRAQCQPQSGIPCPGDPGLGVAQGELGAAWGGLGPLAQWDITGSSAAPSPALSPHGRMGTPQPGWGAPLWG